jgi:hypothetical protein
VSKSALDKIGDELRGRYRVEPAGRGVLRISAMKGFMGMGELERILDLARRNRARVKATAVFVTRRVRRRPFSLGRRRKRGGEVGVELA